MYIVIVLLTFIFKCNCWKANKHQVIYFILYTSINLDHVLIYTRISNSFKKVYTYVILVFHELEIQVFSGLTFLRCRNAPRTPVVRICAS